MAKNIRMSVFDPASIQKALEETKKLKDRIKNGNDRFVNEIASNVRDNAEFLYGIAEYDGDKGVITVSVYPSQQQSMNLSAAVVSAEGDKVLFIEFGTGVAPEDLKEGRYDVISGDVAYRGQYGKTKLFKRTNGLLWVYKGADGNKHFSYGNASNNCMYNAKKYVTTSGYYLEVAKEVFDL